MDANAPWQAVEQRIGLTGLAQAAVRTFAGSADPEPAAARAHEILVAVHEAAPEALASAWRSNAPNVLRVLSTLCGAAPFFTPILERHPKWLCLLAGDDLDEPRALEQIHASLDRALQAVQGDDTLAVLRHVKYFELARITVRELSADLVPEHEERVVLQELSDLADAILARVVEVARARVGDGSWRAADGKTVRPGFCVLALGKLGGEELNYSSDVDLVYIYEATPGPLSGGPREQGVPEYMTRLATELGRLVTPATADGFLYRIDLELRPEGSRGPMVVSSDALAEYYETGAATWERAAFMKARPVAGDLDLGWKVIRAVAPMIFRRSQDFAGVAAIRELKDAVEQEKGRDDGAFNVKIGKGGIRDIECVAQALQMLNGAEIPQVRGRSTAEALVALRDVDRLAADTADDLLAAYLFLRRVENRVQMIGERQVYTLPTADAARMRLARSLGFYGNDPVREFEARLQATCERVQAAFHELLPDAPGARVRSLFARFTSSSPSLATAHLLDQLADGFGREIEAGPDPERAIKNLSRFAEGLGGRTFYYELLLDRGELVRRLAGLFAVSDYLSGILAVHPRLIEPIFDDPETLLVDRSGLEKSFTGIRAELEAEGGTEPELDLDALRLFHKREIVNVGLLDVDDRVTLDEASSALTDIAEVALNEALVVALREMAGRAPAGEAQFLVVGMGKLGTRELTYGSDLDVIFLYSLDGGDALEAQEFYVRLTQKLIWVLQTRTSAGICYDIDTRLRPSGNQGLLVTSFASFESYHRKQAELWEQQAMLRARPVAGETALAERFEAKRLEIVRQPLPDDAASEIHHIRQRMETELAQEDSRRRDFKTGRGGITDVETAVQYLQLRHGSEHEQLLRAESTEVQLAQLAALGCLEERDGAALSRGWTFLTRLSSRLRIVDNRSISDLDEERGDLDGLARQLGYEPGAREGVARRKLLEDYREITEDVRASYRRVLGLD